MCRATLTKIGKYEIFCEVENRLAVKVIPAKFAANLEREIGNTLYLLKEEESYQAELAGRPEFSDDELLLEAELEVFKRHGMLLPEIEEPAVSFNVVNCTGNTLTPAIAII